MEERAPIREEEETEVVSLKPTEELELNERSRRAVAKAGVEVVGTGRKLGEQDMILVRGVFANRAHEKATVKKLEKGLRRANPKWRGVLLHMPKDMELSQLPAVMVEALFEALLTRFEPEMARFRAKKKMAATAEAQAKDEARILNGANAVADHLGAIKAQERAKQGQELERMLGPVRGGLQNLRG